jgi:hypothetical protein
VIAQGDHMPVHLGSMPMAVASALKAIELKPGDVVALNDPFAGGTHLPDVTLVMPVVSGQWSVISGQGAKSIKKKRRELSKYERIAPDFSSVKRAWPPIS